jgi:excisionase family DNA binding protein
MQNTPRYDLNKPTIRGSESDTPDQLLRAQDAARLLAISTRLVWRLRSEGKLPSVRLAGATRFRLSDVKRFIQSGL